MATLLKLLPILSLLLLSAATAGNFLGDDDEPEEYVLDNPFSGERLRGGFLATIRKGKSCDPNTNNVCNGVSANNGTSILYCCKKHCRNVLGDMNNCGGCGLKCKFGQRCCGGVCSDVLYDPLRCGKCTVACLPGVPCKFGYCGYA